jgi:hypothetical protein
VGDLTTPQLRRIGQGHCPDCGHRGFVIGPQGGININIECGNLACRSRFNAAFYGGSVVTAHRIESRAEGGPAWGSEPLQ